MKILIRYSILAVCAVFGLSACGRKSDSGSGQSAGSAESSGSTAGQPASAATSPASGRVVEITANDTMKFSLTEIRAKRGEPLSIKLSNVGQTPKFSMGHNWVLLKSGTNPEAFATDAMNSAATDYVPADKRDMIIAHTKLLGPKESDTVSFVAPDTPGRYPFLCTFPGHVQVGMKGELIVE